eukprot:GHRR01027332.1.p4 GENE.GHRR01027332.1~~GHRR01027332.1.p4  ORF type:complete len:105 (-),score=36.59 GHRR01027332.1:1050-1364(-)
MQPRVTGGCSFVTHTWLLTSAAAAGAPLQIRHYVYQQLAMQLRPVLEQLTKQNQMPPGTPYEFNATAAAKRAISNMAQSIVGSLDDAEIQEQLLRRWELASNWL